MKQVTGAEYYTSQQKRLLSQFERTLNQIKPLLVEKYGEVDSAKFYEDCLHYYAEETIPTIPYIGGSSNPFTSHLIQAATALTIYRIVQRWGKGLDEAEEIIYRGMMQVVASVPKPYLRIYGLWLNSKLRHPRWRQDAQASQLRKYDCDWVFSFVEGKGEPFDYGIDMHECGIIKYLNREGAGELAACLCSVDYVTHAAMGIELRRSQALAFGCQRCDFRFILHGKPVEPVWPPHHPEKNCGKKTS